MTQRIEHLTWLKVLIELFKNITQRIECFFEYDSKNWTFLSMFVFLTKIHRFEPFSTWLRENEPDFQNLTQRIEPSSQKDSKNWSLKDYLIPTTKPSYDSRNWTFFCIWIKEIKLLFQIYDSNYWTFSEQNSQNWTPLKIWLAEQDLFLKNMTHRNWTLLFKMSQRKWLHFWSWFKEYFFFNIRLKEQWSFYFWK